MEESSDKKSAFGLSGNQIERLLSIGSGEEAHGPLREDKDSAERTSSSGASEHSLQIDGYEIIEKITEAGQGRVWRGLQLSTDREVAIKVPRLGSVLSERARARFEREAELMARLKHPNIARIYDSGIYRGQYYHVMDLVDGVDLDKYVQEHKLTERQILELMQTTCQAVQYAHQNGIIHRDLKPSNILVTKEGHPYIVDFGLAKSLLEDDVAVTVSIDGETLGTPAYMSPEQAAGDTDKVDTRTDVYSLGVMLFGLLTGEYPHDLSGSRHQVLHRIAEEPIKRPRKINPKLDKDLEFLLLKSLDNDPDRRYTSAGEMAGDIDNYLRGVPLIAGPESGVYQIKKFVRRNRALVAGVAVVLTVLVAGIIVSTVFAVGQARARAQAEQQEEVSRAVTDFLTNDLLVSASPFGTGGPKLTARLLLDMASENVPRKFGDKPLIEALIRSTLGRTYRLLGYLDIAEQHLEQALQVQRELLGEEHPDTLNTMHRLIRLYAYQFRYEKAEPLAVKTLETRRRVLGEEHVDTLISMYDLAWVIRELGRYDEAEPLHIKTLQMTRRVLGEEHPETSVAMIGLGAQYRRQGRYGEAAKVLVETLEIDRRVRGDGHPRTLTTLLHLAWVYRDQGRNVETEAIYIEVLLIRYRVLGEEHPHFLRSLRQLIEFYEAWDKPEEAEKWRALLRINPQGKLTGQE